MTGLTKCFEFEITTNVNNPNHFFQFKDWVIKKIAPQITYCDMKYRCTRGFIFSNGY